MKTKLKISTQTRYIAILLVLFVSGIALLVASGTEEVSAAPDNINQCYSPPTGAQAVFQMGHFVPNPSFEGALLKVGTVEKANWSYTFFNGNGAAEVSSLIAPVGDSTASIATADAQTEVSQDISFPNVGKYTVFAHGTGGVDGKQPITFSALQEDISAISPNKGKLRVVHVAGFDDDIADLTLDITSDNGTLLIDDLAYASQGYVEVDPGVIDIRAVDQTGSYVIFDLKEFVIQNGELFTIILHGDGADTLGVFQLKDCVSQYGYNFKPFEQPPEFPPSGGRVQFANLAPSSSNPTAASLDLNMNGVVNSDFGGIKYGTSTGYNIFEPNSYTAQIFKPGSDTVLAQLVFNAEDKKDYTIVATGGGSDGTPYQLTLLNDTLIVPAVGKNRFRFGNFLSNGAVPPTLNVESEGSNDIDLQNIAFGQTGVPAYQLLDSGNYDLRVLSGPQTLIDPQAVNFASRSIETFLSAGNGVEQPFGIFRITKGEKGSFVPLNSARLYIAHLAPFADSVDGTAVTLEINGDVIADFSKYGDSTGYLDYAPGEHSIAIKSNGAILASRDVTLVAAKDYTLTFAGTETNLSLSPIAEDDNSTRPSTTNAYLRMGHLASISRNGGFERIDFRNQSGILAEGIDFGEIESNYVGLAAGSLDLDVTLAAKNVSVINPKPIDVDAGDVVTLLTAGNDSPLGRGVYAIINGQKGVFLELEEDVAFLYFANLLALDSDLANTAVTVRIDGNTVLSGIEFGESTDGYIGVVPGTYDVQIIPSNSLAPLIAQTITTEALKPYQLIAHGNATNAKLVFRDEPSAPGTSRVRLSAGNLVPESTPFYDSVSVSRNYAPFATNIAAGTMSAAMVDSTTSLLSFQVTTSDNSVTLIESLPISVAPDSVITVMTAGDGGINQPFGLYAIIDNREIVSLQTTEAPSGEPPKIIVSHFSPYLPSSTPPVALRVNGVIVDPDFRFGDVTNQFNGNLGNNKVEVVDAATEEVLKVTHSVYLGPGDRYFFFVTGGSNDLEMRILGYEDTEQLDAISATVTFLNAAPVPDSITDRRMNLVMADPSFIVSDVPYTFAETIQVDPGNYDPIVVSPDNKRMFADPNEITLAANERVLYVATGNGDTTDVALYEYRIDGETVDVQRVDNFIDTVNFSTTIFLPLVTK
ncbi:MAG: DUF4397 domain-containing protein [Anaerolineae bacterium]